MYKPFLQIGLLTVSIVISGSVAFSQAVREAAYSDEQFSEFKRRSEVIDKGIADPTEPEWSGKFHWGSIGFSGSTLKLGLTSGFVYRAYSDYLSSEIMNSFDYGDVQITKNGSIVLSPQRGI